MRQPLDKVTIALANGCVTGQTYIGWSWVVKLVIHSKVDTTSIDKQCCAEHYRVHSLIPITYSFDLHKIS